jgi:zinc protease
MNMMKLNWLLGLLGGAAVANMASAGIAEHAVRRQAAGLDVIVYPTAVQDVITVSGSLPAGDSYAEQSNIAAATITCMMLDKGTTTQDKFAIAGRLGAVGAQMSFTTGPQMVTVQAQFMKKDLALVMQLMAEELRAPAFSSEEFAKAKKHLEAIVHQARQDTEKRAAEAFSRSIYPQGDPNRQHLSQEWLDAADRLTVEEVRAFHKQYYGPAHFTLIFVGDVNVPQIQKQVAKAFAGWAGGVDIVRAAIPTASPTTSEEVVQIKDKASVSVRLGQSLDLRYEDPDSLALRVATSILGSDFTSRLMSTVRDQEGLTYSIRARIADDTFVHGDWAIAASFSPQLLDQGILSTRRELDKWWQSGVTPVELEARKTNLVGSYQVSLSTSGGMAEAMLQTLERGKPLTWLDDYPKAIQALTVARVNTVIRKYLNPQQMVLVKAGTVTAAGPQSAHSGTQ